LTYIQLTVEGNPVPQGSFRHVGNGRIIAANPKLNTWRETIAWQVAQQTHHRLIEGSIRVDLVFTLPRPKSVTRDRPTVVPDIDKLCRSVLDSISLEKYCQIILNDAMVTDLHAAKRYADFTPPGVQIMITW
jgi:Holliday junction resolvase RusA-like endonuclease